MTKPPSVTTFLRQWMESATHRSMHEWVRFAKSTGLSMPQFSILMQLHHKGVCGVSEIGERFDISNAAASQLVEKLVQGGFLERAEDPNDRRAKQLNLSAQGRKLVSEGIHERYRWVEKIAASLNEEEGKVVMEALNILTEKAKRLDIRD